MGGERLDFTRVGDGSGQSPPGQHQSAGLPAWESPPQPPVRWRKPPFVMIGCGATLVLFLAVSALIGALVYGVMAMLRSGECYAAAVARARENTEVQAKLGTPIEEAWYVLGSTRTNNGTEDVDIQIPLRGSLDSGTLYAEGRARAGIVRFRELTLVLRSTGERIELREE